MIHNWIKIAFRNFANNKLATFINVFGLTIGLIGVFLTTLYWKDELSYNQWNPEKDKVYQVVHDMGNGNIWSSATIPEGPKMKERFPEVEDYLYLNWMQNVLVQTDGKSIYLEGFLTSTSSFFEFFPFPFVEGSPTNVLNDLQSIAISKQWAQQLFGEHAALGKTIKIENQEFIIQGVYNNNFTSSELPNAVAPMNWNEVWENNATSWGNYSYKLYVKLKTNTYSTELLEKINHEIVYVNQIIPLAKESGLTIEQIIEKYGETKIIFDPVSQMRLFAVGDGGTLGKGNLSLLYIMSGLSLIVLLLSCVNFINLTTANAVKRAKEVGVRKAIGAKRKSIVLQFILESLILCSVAFISALTMTEITLPYYNDFFGKSLQLNFDTTLIYFAWILGIVVLISGLFPALYLSNFQALKVLKGNFSRSRSGVWIRNGLLGLQFYISAFFFVGGLVVYLQVQYMMSHELGFNADQTMAIYMQNLQDTARYQKYELIKQTFRNIDGIEDISSGMRLPGYLNNSSSNLNYLDKSVQSTNNAMDYNYLDLLGVKVVEGRNLSADFGSDTITNVLINEKLAKNLGLENPINTEVESGMNNLKFNIVGVVQDYFVEGFQNEIRPTLFYHWKTVDWQKQNLNVVVFKIKSEKTESVLQEIEKRWNAQIEPGFPFRYNFVDEQFARTYEQHKKQKDLFFILTITVLLIAMLGLFGLLSFVIEQRMREISIRKVLGASQTDLLKLFSKKYILITTISIVCSIPVTYYLLQKWLENFAYRIEIPLWPFVIAFVVLILLAFLVIVIRTLSALRQNPIKYLKYE